MSNIQHRQQGEDAAHPDATKENATAGNRGAADRANQTDQHSTRETSRETERERGEYLPLAWARLGGAVEPQQFRGKAKRQARADAIRVKRMGGIGLFDAVAYLAFGAWAATVALWLLEVIV